MTITNYLNKPGGEYLQRVIRVIIRIFVFRVLENSATKRIEENFHFKFSSYRKV